MQLLNATIWLATVTGAAHIPAVRLAVNPLHTVITALGLKILGNPHGKTNKAPHRKFTIIWQAAFTASDIYFLGLPQAAVAFTVSYFSNHLAERINHWINNLPKS